MVPLSGRRQKHHTPLLMYAMILLITFQCTGKIDADVECVHLAVRMGSHIFSVLNVKSFYVLTRTGTVSSNIITNKTEKEDLLKNEISFNPYHFLLQTAHRSKYATLCNFFNNTFFEKLTQ